MSPQKFTDFGSKKSPDWAAGGSSRSNEGSPGNEVQPRSSPPETRVPMNRPDSLPPVSRSNPSGDGTVLVTPFQRLMTPPSAQVPSPLLRMKGPPRMLNMAVVARIAGVSSGVQRTTASSINWTNAAPTAKPASFTSVARASEKPAGGNSSVYPMAFGVKRKARWASPDVPTTTAELLRARGTKKPTGALPIGIACKLEVQSTPRKSSLDVDPRARPLLFTSTGS